MHHHASEASAVWSLGDWLGTLGFALALLLGVWEVLKDRPRIEPEVVLINLGAVSLPANLLLYNLGSRPVPVHVVASEAGQVVPGSLAGGTPPSGPVLPAVLEPGGAMQWTVSAEWVRANAFEDTLGVAVFWYGRAWPFLPVRRRKTVKRRDVSEFLAQIPVAGAGGAPTPPPATGGV